MRFRAGVVLGILFLAFVPPVPAGAQETHTVSGRVVSRSDNGPLRGISVTTAEGRSSLTDSNGRFRLRNIPSGRLILHTTGIGYLPADTVLTIWKDTTIILALEPSPIGLPPLTGEVRYVTIRGDVREPQERAMVADAEVFATPDRRMKTNMAGRFKLSNVPTAAPFEISVGSFGYLLETITFEPQRDTSFLIILHEDAVAQAMIAEQLGKIDARAGGRRYAPLPVLDHDELLKERDHGLLMDVIVYRLGPAAKRLACVLIDENASNAWRKGMLLADEVQRVEFVWWGLDKRRLMARIYTRDFVRDMTGGAGNLVPAEVAMVPGNDLKPTMITRNAAGVVTVRSRRECR